VGEDRTGRPGPTTRRVTVSEAADIIGISAEAVRMRIRRGTLPSERHEGTVYVILDTDRTQRVGNVSVNVSGDRTDELLEALRGQVHDLRDQLQAERQGHAEARRLLAAALERIPAIEAPAETPEAPETVEEPERAAGPRSAGRGAQEGAQRPWWRRMFGG
jgi:hypothetical protein